MILTLNQTILHGKYVIERFIGKGGFGEVYQARSTRLNSVVAVKVIAPGHGSSAPDFEHGQQLFETEAQVGAQITHENVIKVYDFDFEGDTWFLISEFAAGGSLKEKLARGPLPVAEAVNHAIQVCEGAAALHRSGYVHRDIKPSNILFDEAGRAKLTDLGLVQTGASIEREIGMGGYQPGTLLYMSPEQEHSRDALRPSADVFSIGCVLFEMLTGKVYKMLPAGTSLRSINPRVSPQLEATLAKALAVVVGQRYADGDAFAAALGECAQAAVPIPVPEHGKKFLLFILAGLAALLLFAVVYYTRRPPSPPPEPQPTAALAIPTSGSLIVTQSATAASEPSATQIATTTAKPTSTPPPPNTTHSAPLPVIGPHNAGQVTQRARLDKGTVDEVAWSPDGQQIAVASSLGIYFYHVDGLEEIRFIDTQEGISSLAFSPDGRTLASGSGDGAVRLWNTGTGKKVRTLQGHTWRSGSVSFAADGRTLASGSYGNSVRLWDTASLERLRTLEGHADRVTSVAFSPVGRTLASGSDDHTVRLWDAESGALLSTLEGHADGVSSVAFSPDGLLLASGSNDDTVRLWDVAAGALLRTLQEHTFEVSSVAFSPDGLLLASGSDDNTVRLWDVESGELLRTLTGHTSSVYRVAFSPDGRMLASGSEDGTVRLWGVVAP